jgi:hypothetical protein
VTVDPAIRPRVVIGGFVVDRVLGDLDGRWTVADGADAEGRPGRVWVSTAEAARDPQVRDGVERLARLGAAPGIDAQPLAPLRAACVFRGRLVVVRGHVAGPTLRDRLDAGPLEPAEAVDVLGRVAAAVEALARFGVQHAHLSPSAIVLPHRSATAAVLQSYGFPPAPGPAELDPALEDHVQYLAPELADDGRSSPAGDVYALAALLVECLIGRPPFPPDPPLDVLAAHRSEAPAPIAAAAGLPAELDEVLQAALAKRPEDRPSSALGLMRAVCAAFEGRTIQQAPPAPRASATSVAEQQEAMPSPTVEEQQAPSAPSATVAEQQAASPSPPSRRRPPRPSWSVRRPALPSLAGLVRRPPLPSPKRRLAVSPRTAAVTLPAIAVVCGLGTAAVIHGGHGDASARSAIAAQQASAAQRAAVLAAVDRTMDRLEAQRADGRAALRGAGDHRRQAAAAAGLARSYDAARRDLPPAAALAHAAPAPELATQLAGVQRAYGALARTMRAQDQRAYQRSRRLVLARERRLEATLGRLARKA